MKGSVARVPKEEAEKRALAALNHRFPTRPSRVADVVWPGHQMKSQGAGFAAVQVLKRLEEKGLAHWVSRGPPVNDWGWVLGKR